MGKRFSNVYYLFVGAVVSALISFIISGSNHRTTEELAQRAENQLHQKEQLARQKLTQFASYLKTNPASQLFKKHAGEVADLYRQSGIALYVYDHDSLCFWTDNQPAVDLYAYTNESDVQLIKIRNGWYEYIRQVDNVKEPYTLVALIAIKPEYDFENRYLNNKFSSWLYLPDNTELVTPVTLWKHTIKSQTGSPLFEIKRDGTLYRSTTRSMYACIFAIIALICFIVFLYLFLKRIIKHDAIVVLLFGVSCFLIRTLMIWLRFPAVFYESGLYDAGIFADASSFYFSLLGDVLLNSLLLFGFAVGIYKARQEVGASKVSVKILVLTGGILLLAYFSYHIHKLIYSLVNNSTISFNINELFKFSEYSVAGLLSLGLLMFAFYLMLEKIIIKAFNNDWITRQVIVLIIVLLLLLFAWIKYNELNVLEYLWPVPLVLMSYFLRKYKASYNFINIGLIILISTLIVSGLFNRYEKINKRQTYDALSMTLTDRQDIIAENEFNKVSNSIKTDIKIKNLLSLLPLSSDKLEQSLRQINFSGYFERYDIVLSLFKSDHTPVFKLNDTIYLDEDYFKLQIKKDGYQTISDDLYFIDQDKKPIRYVADIPIEDINKNPEKTWHLYAQLEPKLASNLGAFPDLLLDRSLESKLESKDVSYAVYENNKLLQSHGEYQYPLFVKNSNFTTVKDDYEHFSYHNKKNSLTVISDKRDGFWQNFTSNSYLFIFFSLLVLLSVLFNSIVIKRSNSFKSLNNRIQFIFVGIVVLSLTGVVIGTVWVVSIQFETKNQKELIAKALSVSKEIQQNIGDQQRLEPTTRDFATYTLKRLSQLYGSDISLFNRRGMLYATSQPAIYDQGLISRFMDPDAYAAFAGQIRANYSHRENIGSLNYLSAYIPLYNQKDKHIGYINLPYFSRQKDLEKELTAYLTTLINIYTILFAITTLVALLVSNLLTKPLRIIKQQISKIQFGSFNESIQWESQDEIGSLIMEYNNMLVKLEKSSELLAQSERESAWREMAKQVAHEIKNPLTPMKLSIQHLQRVVQTNPEDINERVNKVAQMLIEQIDTLSHIATEFSNFAKLPKANPEIVNLTDVLRNVADLFRQSSEGEIDMYVSDSLFIMADKEQCIRIFTNLLKNAEQAFAPNRKGKIEIHAGLQNDFVVISIKDNGLGIPEPIQSKIFTPNFTTKSTGTGLGLAMVKNFVNSFNGTISFETEFNKGTTFTLSFPAASQNSL